MNSVVNSGRTWKLHHVQLSPNRYYLIQQAMSVHQFVAHFLKKEGYLETLKTFENEHGKPIFQQLPHEEDLHDIITDRLQCISIEEKPQSLHEVLLSEELKTLKKNQFKEWLAPYPNAPRNIAGVGDLVVASAFYETKETTYGLFATAKMDLIVSDLARNTVVSVNPRVIGTVVRNIKVVGSSILLCGMNGKLYVGRLNEDNKFEVMYEEQIHTKLITEIVPVQWNDKIYLVTMGWDFLVKLYEMKEDSIVEAVVPYQLPNRGLCMDACVYQDQLVVVVGKSEMTLMDVLTINDTKLDLSFKIALNDAEFTAAGFSPHAVKICNGGPIPLVAVGTSHEPYMRLVLVSLKEFGKNGDSVRRNQIITNINTMSPQDKYSQALISWRSDGSGIWVFGEDGIVRGVDLLKEGVVVELKRGEGRIKSFDAKANGLLVCDTDRNVVEWAT